MKLKTVLLTTLLMAGMTIQSFAVSVVVNGQMLKSDNPIQIIDNRAFIPVSVVADTTGAEVNWEQTTKTVVMKKDAEEIRFQIGAMTATKNGGSISLDAPAQIINGRTMIPLSFVSSNFNIPVFHDPVTNTLLIVEATKEKEIRLIERFYASLENPIVLLCLFIFLIVILVIAHIKIREYYIEKQIKNKKYFYMNEFIYNILDDFIESNKKKKSTLSIDNLNFDGCSKNDLINCRNALSEMEDIDRNIMTSTYVSTISLGFSWITRGEMTPLSMAFSIIMVLLLASIAVYLVADTFNSTWLNGKKYLIDLYLQKHYPND